MFRPVLSAGKPSWASPPVFCLIAAVLYINEFPYYNADRAVGKRALAVRLGREKAVRGYEVLLGATYLSLAAGGGSPTVAALLSPRRSHTSFDIPRLVPANTITDLNHSLTGALTILGYVPYGFRLLWAP
ncbi:MAG: hypothetical protein QW057_00735 [Candidatus Bathyarchaeia archaeon]